MKIIRQEGFYSIETEAELFIIETDRVGESEQILFKGESKDSPFSLVLPQTRLMSLSGLEYPDIDTLMSVGIIAYYKWLIIELKK